MDFWSQFWATMWGALAGALVAGGLSALIAWRSWVNARDAGYKDRLDDALSGLMVEIRKVIELNEVRRVTVELRNAQAATSGLLVEVDRVHMLARGNDATMLTMIGKVIYALPRRSPTWAVTNLPTLVENIRMWRTNEIKFDKAAAAIEDLAD